MRVFYNTGFNTANIPYSADIITSNFTGTSRTFDSVFELQNKGLGQIKIKATWEQIDGADYLMLSKSDVDIWYFITNITMINENTAVLDLAIDALTTIGLNNLTDESFVSGLTVRNHPDDYKKLFANNLEEPWSVASPLKILGYMIIGATTDADKGFVHIIGSTVNLHGPWYEASKWTDLVGTESDYVYTPKCPKFDQSNGISFVGIQTETTRYMKQVPANTLYQFNVDVNINDIQPLLEIGLLDCLTCSYSVPEGYIADITKSSGDEAYITSLVGDFASYQISTLPYEYIDGIINKKVFSHYCHYTLTSISTGDEIEFNPYDIYEEGTNHPSFVTFADVSSEGRPYARPKVYEGNKDLLYMASVQGANWLNTPLRFTGANNAYYTDARKAISDKIYKDTKALNTAKGLTGGILGTAKGFGSGPTHLEMPNTYFSPDRDRNRMSTLNSLVGAVKGGGINPIANTVSSAEAIYGNEMQHEIENLEYFQSKIVSPSILFANQPTLQNYFGNMFCVTFIGQTKESAQLDDRMFSMFGEAIQPHKTVKRDFNSRLNFNFIKTVGISLRTTQSRYINEIAELQLQNGVRVWHKVPSPSYYAIDNPVVANS